MKLSRPAIATVALALLAGAFPAAVPAAPSPVPSAPGAVPTDSEITSAVSLKLFSDPFFSPRQIQVRTDAGIVSLTGPVNDLRSKERAVRIAEGIRGVRAVVDRLAVRAVKRSDGDIRDDVTQALFLDPTTDSYKAKVRVKDGVVHLGGVVQSWAERNLTSWVAKGVPGVKEVRNDMALQPKSVRPDMEIAQDIEGRLRRDPDVATSDVRVSVHQGQVRLRGTVGSAAAKRAAFDASWVGGVKAVDFDGIEVNPALAASPEKGGAARPDDAAILSAVRSAFLWDPRTNYFDVKAGVKDGVVTLDGSVDSLAAKDAAEQDARNTVGVLAVVNRIEIQRKARPDSAIAADVRRSLSWNLSGPTPTSVEVKVDGGTVSLSGTVGSPYQRWQARDAASRVNGVVAVNNQVQVRAKGGAAAPSDDELEKLIRREISWDPGIVPGTSQINVSVDDGLARLTGTVKTWSDRWEATRDAFEAGADRVQNSLEVQGSGVRRTTLYENFPLFTVTEIYVPMS